jgi:protein involved in polysaccharide export with SLBB domain
MNINMYQSFWNCFSGSRRTLIYVILLGLGLVVSPCGAIAQSSSSSSSSASPASPASSTSPAQTGNHDDDSSAKGLEQPRPEMTNQSTPERAGSQSNQEPVLESAQDQPEQTMSAEQIISILRQEPVAMQRIKEQVAQQTGADPTTITDDSLYARVRQSESVRALATQELSTRGYSPNQAPTNTPNMQQGGRSARPGARTLRAPNEPYESPDDPQVQHMVSPYANFPSLSDLYSQFPPTQPKLQRFGSDAFLIGTGNANELPMDLPAGPEYVLGPGDMLMLNLWGSRTERLSRAIDRQGQVELPEAGTIMVSGMTIAQAQSAMEKVLNTQFQKEHVEISLGRVRTVRVYVVGDVQRPGAYDVSSLSTPLSALYEAGGPTSRGSLRILRQYRGNELVRQFDLYDFLLRGVRSDSERLLPGDTLLVPPTGPQVTVEGMVHRPAIYELNGEQSLDQVLELAGGVLTSANLKQINVARIEAHQSRSMFNLQLPDNQAELHDKLAGFKIRDGDDLIISQILPYNAQAVYLRGHVFHPGRFPYREGMTVADLLHSFEDILPEPSDHAELVRLRSPDLRPETISFNLHDVLVGNDSIPLRPFDSIRIFGRYEIDSPQVSIDGEVIRPGTYPMSQGMTVSGLVNMAGGFRRSAYQEEADLTSYTVQDGKRVLSAHSTVAILDALKGNKSADVVLKPGDIVSIRTLSGWQDIGASVTVSGEVTHAGTYGIASGERLSSVLKRAGGFSRDAFPYGAVYERVQVRQLAEQARQRMILRVETTPLSVKQGVTPQQNTSDQLQALELQRQEVLTALRTHPASGRLVINITSDISQWENTPADIELRAGDTLVIPKRPNFVSVSGQVYNPVSISYVSGKKLDWYLNKAGGATHSGDKKDIYVLRVDGSVVPQGSAKDHSLRPGDAILVPEKALGGSQVWQNVIATAQIMAALTIPLAIAGVI